MKNIFLKGVVFSLGFCLTIGAFILTYAAWTNLGDVDKNTSLTDTLWNQMIGNINQLKTTTDTLDNNYNSLFNTVNGLTLNSIPTGAVIAFNGTSCPTGWTAADGSGDEKNTSGINTILDLRGQFIRGLDASRVIRSWQDGSTKLLMNGAVDPANPGNSPEGNSPDGIIMHKPGVEMIGINTGFWGPYTGRYTLRSAMDTNWGGAPETRPVNIALLYCVKN